jgi:hypothetical protein
MKIGSTNIINAKIGSTNIQKVFSGSDLVWQESQPYLLDSYPATAAFSVRKLSSTATLCMRVRRSSDNAEQDIGFVGNDLDTASLLSFVGAGNGFVVRWYDQQGSNNVVQTSSASQPRIVSSGVLDVKNGIAAPRFDGSNDSLIKSSLTINANNISFFSVSASNVLNSVGTIHSQMSNLTSTIRTFCDTRNTSNQNLFITNTSSVNFAAAMSTARNNTNQRLLSSFIDGSNNMSAFDNAATGGTATYTGSVNNDGLYLGVQAAVTWLNGHIQEFIAFNTNESANRTAIETNINTYYGIY